MASLPATLKFSSNISTMFLEEDEMLDRYKAAKERGFKAVECQFPYDYSPEYIRRVKVSSGLHHDLINSFPGDIEEGEFGLACLPGREVEFIHSISKTIEYATSLQCSKVHILCGLPNLNRFSMEDHRIVLRKNLENAAEMLEEQNLIALIEPICPDIKENYYISSFETAVDVLKEVRRPNLKILLDVFHLHMLHGDVISAIRNYYPYSGHIQVSQAPSRHELNYPGEINYKEVFQLLSELGHKDYIGLEYMPSGTTAESLKWLDEFGYKL